MTDNDIIKALECCISTLPSDCRECPLFCETNSKMVCSKILIKLVFNLINRQRAEIERLTSIHDKLCCEISDIVHINLEEYEKIRAEAVKGFVERLKKEVAPFVANAPDVCEVINNLLKEMVGEQG